MTTTVAAKWIYDFAEGSRDMRELLGGKGSGIAEMTRILDAGRVPAGFTITTEACVEYMRTASPPERPRREQVDQALARLEDHAEKRLGDADDPLLLPSVRSGARKSMPGMLDTVLNLGLNDESVHRSGGANWQRPLRVGLLSPARADVRRRRARRAQRALRGRDRTASSASAA